MPGIPSASGKPRAKPMAYRVEIRHLHRAFAVVVADDGALELWLDGCLRKRREAGRRQPLHVWTNIELDWEEHHYVEARYNADRRELRVTINGEPVLARQLPPIPATNAAGNARRAAVET